MYRARGIFLLLMCLLARTAAASPESVFWSWFQKNEIEVFNFESNQEVVFDKLAEQMHKVDSRLTFEFGPKESGKREFVISADGIKSAFPSVEKLYAAAPPLKMWKVTKFRPRRDPFDINYKGISVRASTVTVSVSRDGSTAGLTVLIPGYIAARQSTYMAIAYLFLDQALGEYDVETRVGLIDVAAPSAQNRQPVPLAKLPETLDAFFLRTMH